MWRLSAVLLFYGVTNHPTLKRPRAAFTRHIRIQTHTGVYNYSNIFAKGAWLSLHTREPCGHGDTTSFTVTLCLTNFKCPLFASVSGQLPSFPSDMLVSHTNMQGPLSLAPCVTFIMGFLMRAQDKTKNVSCTTLTGIQKTFQVLLFINYIISDVTDRTLKQGQRF